MYIFLKFIDIMKFLICRENYKQHTLILDAKLCFSLLENKKHKNKKWRKVVKNEGKKRIKYNHFYFQASTNHYIENKKVRQIHCLSILQLYSSFVNNASNNSNHFFPQIVSPNSLVHIKKSQAKKIFFGRDYPSSQVLFSQTYSNAFQLNFNLLL